MNIAFVEGPVTKEEKKEYNAKGFRVVDIRFAPEKLKDGDKKVLKKKAK